MECAGSERARKGCRVWSALIQSPFTLAYDPLPAQPWLLWQKISSKSYSRCSLPVCVPTGKRGIHPGSGSLASVPAGDVQWQWQLLLSTVLRREWYLCVPSQVHHFQLQGWSILWATNSLVTPHTYLTPMNSRFQEPSLQKGKGCKCHSLPESSTNRSPPVFMGSTAFPGVRSQALSL